MSGYYLLHNGEYAYNKSYSVGYDFGSIKRLDRYPMGALSTLYICFALKKHDSDFIKAYFDSLKWYREIYMISAEGARNHGLLNVPTDEFFDTKHHLPNNPAEQRKIADFLITLDRRIATQQTLVENLKKYKRGAVKSLFTQEVSLAGNIPKWEKHKMSDLITLQSGQDFAPSDYNDQCEGIPYMTGASCIVDGRTVVSRWTAVPRCFAYRGDTLLVCKGSGSGAVVMLSQDKAHIARQFNLLNCCSAVFQCLSFLCCHSPTLSCKCGVDMFQFNSQVSTSVFLRNRSLNNLHEQIADRHPLLDSCSLDLLFIVFGAVDS